MGQVNLSIKVKLVHLLIFLRAQTKFKFITNIYLFFSNTNQIQVYHQISLHVQV